LQNGHDCNKINDETDNVSDEIYCSHILFEPFHVFH